MWGNDEPTIEFVILAEHVEAIHGKPTFVGTRILVTDVLEQVATGMAWEAIVDDWRGDVSKEAIAEAVRLAREVLLAHEHDLIAG